MKWYYYTGALVIASTVAISGYTLQSTALAGITVTKETLNTELEKSKTKDGTYTQILKDGTVADGKTFDTSKLPPNTYVNVYGGKDGSGYQVVTEYDDRIEYVGYGGLARDYTFTIQKTVTGVATST